MALSDQLETAKDKLQRGAYASESAVSQGVLMPVLQELGWAVFNSAEVVIPEYQHQLEGRRVDFALCHPAKRPMVFVEVKNVGLLGGAARQLFEYAFHSGVPMAVLTDGREWIFFRCADRSRHRRVGSRTAAPSACHFRSTVLMESRILRAAAITVPSSRNPMVLRAVDAPPCGVPLPRCRTVARLVHPTRH